MGVGQIHIFVAQPRLESSRCAAAERDQRLHLFQPCIFFKPLRIEKGRQPGHSLRDLRRDNENAARSRERGAHDQDWARPGNKHHDERSRCEQNGRAEVDLEQNQRQQ